MSIIYSTLTLIYVGWTMTLLGDVEDPNVDSTIALWVLVGLTVWTVLGTMFLRLKMPWNRPEMAFDFPAFIIRITMVFVALSNSIGLLGFLGFYFGVGLPVATGALVVSVTMLFLVAPPRLSMMERLAERWGHPWHAPDMWQQLLEP